MSSDAADKGVHALEMRFIEVLRKPVKKPHICPSGGMVDTTVSKAVAKACGFESHLRHQRGIRKIKNVERQ